jgi:hypothetical protein
LTAKTTSSREASAPCYGISESLKLTGNNIKSDSASSGADSNFIINQQKGVVVFDVNDTTALCKWVDDWQSASAALLLYFEKHAETNPFTGSGSLHIGISQDLQTTNFNSLVHKIQVDGPLANHHSSAAITANVAASVNMQYSSFSIEASDVVRHISDYCANAAKSLRIILWTDSALTVRIGPKLSFIARPIVPCLQTSSENDLETHGQSSHGSASHGSTSDRMQSDTSSTRFYASVAASMW